MDNASTFCSPAPEKQEILILIDKIIVMEYYGNCNYITSSAQGRANIKYECPKDAVRGKLTVC